MQWNLIQKQEKFWKPHKWMGQCACVHNLYQGKVLFLSTQICGFCQTYTAVCQPPIKNKAGGKHSHV